MLTARAGMRQDEAIIKRPWHAGTEMPILLERIPLRHSLHPPGMAEARVAIQQIVDQLIIVVVCHIV